MFHFDPQKQLGEDRPKLVFKVISSKEHTIDVGAHRDAPLQVNDKSDQNLVKIFLEIT